MKKFRVFVVLALVMSACAPGLRSTAVSTQPLVLTNPGFEGEYVTVPGGYAAYGWASFYTEGKRPPFADTGGGDNPTRRPEFKPILADQYPERVAEGEKAQVLFAFFGIMDAAFSQQVAVEPGQRIQFSVQAHGWSTNTDDPSHNTGDVHVSLGIGAEGQTWPWEHGIVWTRWNWTPAEYRTYTSRAVTAEAERVTLFIRVTNKWASKHNDGYIDAAQAWVVLDGTQPTPPTPEPCPTCAACPAVTPCPTNEPCESGTPCPTPSCPDLPSCPPCVSLDWERMDELIERKLKEREPAYYPVLP